jgi:prevent-host-death family protein
MAGVAELKANLSQYLDQVRRGEEVVITDRGAPIARLVPLEGRVEEDARIERLVREGVLSPGSGRFPEALLTTPPGDPALGAAVLAALIEERREGR